MRYMSPLKKSLSKKWVRYISRRKHTSVTRGRSIPLLLFFFAFYCLIKLHGYLDHYDVLVSDRADVGLVKTITEYGLGDTDALTLDEWTDASESSEQVVSQTTPMVRNTSPIPSHYSNTPPFPITVKDENASVKDLNPNLSSVPLLQCAQRDLVIDIEVLSLI